MASYYYLVASLPMLRFEDPPPITLAQFLKTCEQNMGEHAYALVKGLAEGHITEIHEKHAYLSQWYTRVSDVKRALHRSRAKALSRTEAASDEHQALDIHAQEVVKQAMQADDPLAAELLLMRYWWDQAEELRTSGYFTLEVLFTYTIQLDLLERKALFTPMEGNAEFKRLFSNLQSIIKSI